MKALLLAAGEGTRLRPLTCSVPKCLVPIADKPLLEYWLENLTNAGISEFLINTHYLNEHVEEFVKSSPYKEKITLVHEKELLNTGGTVLANRDFFKDETFILVHADNLCFCDFDAFIDAHKNRDEKCDMTMMLFNSDSPSSCGIVERDEKGIVHGFYEKVKDPPSNLANAAVYICEPNIFDLLESLNKQRCDFSLDVIPEYIGRINTYLNDVYHRDIGTPDSYEAANKEIENIPKRYLQKY